MWPRLTKCGQGWGLPACQVSSLSIQPFGLATIHQRYRETGQRSDSIGRTVLQTVAQKTGSGRPARVTTDAVQMGQKTGRSGKTCSAIVLCWQRPLLLMGSGESWPIQHTVIMIPRESAPLVALPTLSQLTTPRDEPPCQIWCKSVLVLEKPLLSTRQHQTNDDCSLEDKTKDYQSCSVLYCVQWYEHAYEQFLRWLWCTFRFSYILRFCCFNLGRFVRFWVSFCFLFSLCTFFFHYSH